MQIFAIDYFFHRDETRAKVRKHMNVFTVVKQLHNQPMDDRPLLKKLSKEEKLTVDEGKLLLNEAVTPEEVLLEEEVAIFREQWLMFLKEKTDCEKPGNVWNLKTTQGLTWDFRGKFRGGEQRRACMFLIPSR